MRTVLLFLVFFISTYNSFSQKNYTVVFRTHKLVIQDSVSFCYYESFSNKKNKVPVPLGSGYWPKTAYFHSPKGIEIYMQGTYKKPKTYRLVERKCDKGEWLITNEKKEIAGYKCVKATGKRNGNNFTVWYSPDLPVGFGVYMLTSLPGTILEYKNEDVGYSDVAIEVKNEALQIVEPNFCKKIKGIK